MSDSINLEHLRKEAKHILKQCHSRDASAIERMRKQLPRLTAEQIKLADVHHALARELGFANWAALKRQDHPLARFLAAVRSGDLRAAQRELDRAAGIAEESIHAAAVIGDVDAVRHYLDLDPAFLYAEEEGWPPLIYACASRFPELDFRYAAGVLECAMLLLDRGADPNTYTLSDASNPDTRLPAIVRARFNSNHEIARLLIQRGALDVDNLSMAKALKGLMRRPQPELSQVIMKLQADPRFAEEMRRLFMPFREFHLERRPLTNDQGEPAFLRDPILRSAAIEIAEFVLKQGINPNVATKSDGGTILHDTVKLGDTPLAVEVSEWLMAHGADPNVSRRDGKTPFVLTVRAGNRAVADAMRAHGARAASINPIDELIGAWSRRDEAMARSILHAHPEALILGPEDREAVVKAAADNRLDDIRFMANLGLDFGITGALSVTPLHAAAWQGHLAVVQLLLDRGAPVNLRDEMYGTSPLGWAAHGSKHAPDARTKTDDYCNIITRLLKAEADYTLAVNRWGIGPFEIASDEVRSLLQSLGIV